MEQLQTEALGLLQIIIGGVISVAGAYATIYIKKAIALAKEKAESIKDEQSKALVTSTLDKVDNLIETNIVSVENTMKPAILKAIENGKVDKSELNSLSTIVKDNVLKQLGTDATKVFNSSLKDTNSYLENRIEKILAELKSADGTEVNKTVLPEVIAATIDTESIVKENAELKAKLNQVQSLATVQA
jgi:hypothetical protein